MRSSAPALQRGPKVVALPAIPYGVQAGLIGLVAVPVALCVEYYTFRVFYAG